jgi:hypothetical protein
LRRAAASRAAASRACSASIRRWLSLPKAVVESFGTPEYFEVEVRAGQVIVSPVRIQRGDAVRGRPAALGLTPTDVEDAVRWARSTSVAPVAAEPPPPGYGPERSPSKGTKGARRR